MEIDREHPVCTGDGDQIGASLAEIGVRGPGFGDPAGIAEIGMTAVMRLAEARRSASMQISSSMRLSLAGKPVDCRRTSSSADILLDHDEHFLVGEAADARAGERDFEIVRNAARQRQLELPVIIS